LQNSNESWTNRRCYENTDNDSGDGAGRDKMADATAADGVDRDSEEVNNYRSYKMTIEELAEKATDQDNFSLEGNVVIHSGGADQDLTISGCHYDSEKKELVINVY
jgi:hypothetical protein